MDSTIGTRRAAQFSKRESTNALRASVFDVFVQLGAFEKGSQVADWILNDADTSSSSSSSSHAFSTEPVQRTPSGSKYRERFDSFILPDLSDDSSPPSLAESRASRPKLHFLSRLRSARSLRTPPPSASSEVDIPDCLSPKKKGSLLRFRSIANLRRTALEERPVPSRSMSAVGNYDSGHVGQTKRREVFRSKTQPGPADPVPSREISEEEADAEWDELSSVVIEVAEASRFNTFLSGTSAEAHPDAGRQADLFRSLSDVMHNRKNLVLFPSHRNHSLPEQSGDLAPSRSSI